jgi:hypothetical protein
MIIPAATVANRSVSIAVRVARIDALVRLG